MLHKKCAVPVGTATFAVGMVGFFEGRHIWIDDDDRSSNECTNVGSVPGRGNTSSKSSNISGLTLLGIAIVIVEAICWSTFY